MGFANVMPRRVWWADATRRREAVKATVIIACTTAAVLFSAARVAADPSYTAAVIEYSFAPQPLPNNTDPSGSGSGDGSGSGVFNRTGAVAYMALNIAAFAQYLQSATSGTALNASGGVSPAAQIVVFPEYGVLGWPAAGAWTRDSVLPFLEPIPAPGSAVALDPCARAHPTLQAVTRALSCLALQYRTTVVADYGDVETCDAALTPGCPADGRLQYNTAVAFGPDGALLARYRKCHLFGGEIWFFDSANATTPGVACPNAVFDADFGVTFQLLICYDIMFTAPARGVRHTAFPTFWVNNLRPPNATAEQQSWTQANAPQTLLAANIGSEGAASSGSGIWRDGIAWAEYVNTSPSPDAHLLLATLPATPNI